MTVEATGLALDFARKHPAVLASSVAQWSTEEILELLESLPKDTAASILARLSPQRAENVLQKNSPSHIEWIAQGSLEDAKAILVRLPGKRRKDLVKKLPKSPNRLQLMRFLNYPKHSLGRYVSDQIITAPIQMPTTEVLQLIRSSKSGLPVVVIDAERHYVGLLDERLVLEGNSDLPISSYVNKVSPLLAELPLADAMDISHWENHPILPVVDHEEHVLGVVSRQALIKSLDTYATNAKPSNNIITFFQLYIKVMVKLSETLFRSNSRP